MMHRCSSGSSGNMMGPCSCGLFHHQQQQHQYSYPYQHSQNMYSFMSPPSSVDCTLSLGTPSTRLVEDERLRNQQQHQRSSSSSSSSSCMPNFCWDFLQTSRNSPYPPQLTNQKPTRGNGTNSSSSNDPLLARRCANCDTTSTPLWRNGPRGPKSLCNACGIRFKKEERRANANTNGMMDHHNQHQQQYYQNNYNNYQSQGQKMGCYSNEFRFMEENEPQNSSGGDGGGGIPFLSWRLNVADRPSLVHDFTR